jgi:hypothetical protein
VVTYTATGSENALSSSGFSLIATNPSPAVDSCGVHFADPDNHTITLSGSSCSGGFGTWLHTGGSGTTTWTSKQQRNSVTPTSTKTTAHYNVEYAAYIPVDNVHGAAVCQYVLGGQPSLLFLLYLGDAFRHSHRTDQAVIVIPDAMKEYNFSYDVGQTRNYGFGSPVNGSTIQSVFTGFSYSGADEDPTPNDCFLWNAAAYADTSNMRQHSISYPYATQAQVHFFGYAGNPLDLSLGLGPIGAINWDMNVVIDDSTPTAPTAYVNFNHTCYPAHIVKVNGTVIYEKLPTYNNSAYVAACLLQIIPKTTGVSLPTTVNSQ